MITITGDWVRALSQHIVRMLRPLDTDEACRDQTDVIERLIIDVCPFERDVAYVEAPIVSVARCLDCGLPYADFPLDVILPRPQWLEIHPADGGLLCAACIVKRASRVPGCTCVHAILEIAPQRIRESPCPIR